MWHWLEAELRLSDISHVSVLLYVNVSLFTAGIIPQCGLAFHWHCGAIVVNHSLSYA